MEENKNNFIFSFIIVSTNNYVTFIIPTYGTDYGRSLFFIFSIFSTYNPYHIKVRATWVCLFIFLNKQNLNKKVIRFFFAKWPLRAEGDVCGLH